MPTDPSPAGPVVRPGRPSRSSAAQLTTRILDAATTRFLAGGYGATSIEAVAKAARISKRTFYHRFAGKAELFEAVVRRLIEGWRMPFDAATAAPRGPLEAQLAQIARFILAAALSPPAVALHRLILAEAARFPELARVINGHGHAQGVRALAALLEAEVRAGRLAIADPGFAAEQFLHLVVAGPQRRALGLDTPLDARELERWVHNTVALFLNGVPRGTQRP
jgi:TetR/AcrR family transcriptional repressor of mexJK operon